MSSYSNVVLGLCMIAAILFESKCQSFRQCKTCSGAKDLADCAGLINCTSTERCYMEEIIDIDTAKISYNAGCRSQAGCGKANAEFGRKKRDVLVSCARCCLDPYDSKTRKACNEFLCGIPQGDVTGKCYKCGDFQSETGVSSIDECNKIVECEPNEMCRAAKYEVSGQRHYIFGCFRKTACQVLGLRALQQHAVYYKSRVPTLNHRKLHLCDMCCGDGLCNKDDCTRMTESMYIKWKAGRLDLHTLKTINGTASVAPKPAATTQPTTPLPTTQSTTPTTKSTSTPTPTTSTTKPTTTPPPTTSTTKPTTTPPPTTSTTKSTTAPAPIKTTTKPSTAPTRVTLTASTPPTVISPSATTSPTSPVPPTATAKSASSVNPSPSVFAGATVTNGKVTFGAKSVAISVTPGGTRAPPVRNGSPAPAIG